MDWIQWLIWPMCHSMHILAPARKGIKLKCRLFDMKVKSVVALLQRTSVFHSITPFPWLFIYLILNLTAIESTYKWDLPLIKIRRGLLYRTKTKERKRVDPRILQVCVCPTKWDFHSSSHCTSMASSQSIKVKLLDRSAFFWVMYCSLPSLGTTNTRAVLLGSHRGLSQACLRGRKGSSSTVLITAGPICPPVNRSCSALRDTNFSAKYN